MGLHLTPQSSAYLEVGLLLQNHVIYLFISHPQGTWVWNADHSLDAPNNELTLYSGRGIYSQSAGPVWMVGTGALKVV